MRTDSLFYRLFQTDPGLVFEIAGLTVPEPERYRFVAAEVKQTAFRLDGVLEPPRDHPDAPLVFLEAQAQPDAGFYLRFIGEALLYLRQCAKAPAWRAVAFYPDAAVERVEPATEPLLRLPNLHRVYLDRLPLLESPNPKLWLLALILAPEPRLPAIVDQVERYRRGHPGDGVDWLDWLETILVYKLPKLSREDIAAMFNLNQSDLKNTRFYQQVFGEGKDEGRFEGRNEGRNEGRVEGRVEGRAEGRIEGEAEVVRRQLERRFGPLPEGARTRLAAADADTLLRWADRLLDARSLDEVFAP